jgi:predicted RNA-binding protein (virulence factor B family)
MISTGRAQKLTILRSTDFGFFLGDGAGNEVLLPNKYRPEDKEQGDEMEVFVYRDSEDRQVATTLRPKLMLGDFAPLQVTAVTPVGAFMDWGLEKDLLVPFKEQYKPLEVGRWFVVRLILDEKTDRLYGSTRVERFLKNEALTVQEGDAVDLLVFRRTELGWPVIVNGLHLGLVHANEVFKPIAVGNRLEGFVRHVRPDGKLDITLQAPGYVHYNSANTELLTRRLQQHAGFLPLTDKSAPEEVYRVLGISKKAFKQALGALYKARAVRIGEDGIHLLEGAARKPGPPM